ncbi:MAG TPA: restriction endonuclease subunit S [Aquabacterium sp.]|nr:restriction endonuclease subunit S [Aquabacterium sp.]
MDALIDYRGKTPKKTEAGIPLITAKVVKDGRLEKPTEFIAEQDFHTWMTRGMPRIGDVVLTTEAPLGEVAQIDRLPVALAQRIVTLRGKAGILDSDYLLYAMQSEPVQAQLRGRSSGTTVVGIKQSELRRVTLDLPPLDQQLEAAATLKSLDRRLELLRETNATLESIAQALFKSWFIDFDPVRAKAEGREPEGMDADTAALFPADFEETTVGPIPKGWRIGTVEDLFVLQRGFDLPASQRTDGPFTVFAASGPHGAHHEPMVRGPGVVTGRSGVIGRVFFCHDDFWPLNTSLWVKQFKAATAPYAYQYLRTMDLARLNAGSAVPTLNRNHVHAQPAVVPSAEPVGAFTAISTPLLQRIRANEQQAAVLAELRDTLLPRLISGKLRLREAEEQAEAALA